MKYVSLYVLCHSISVCWDIKAIRSSMSGSTTLSAVGCCIKWAPQRSRKNKMINALAPNLVKSILIWIGSTRRVQRSIFKNVNASVCKNRVITANKKWNEKRRKNSVGVTTWRNVHAVEDFDNAGFRLRVSCHLYWLFEFRGFCPRWASIENSVGEFSMVPNDYHQYSQ